LPYIAGDSVFSDVTYGHWAHSYITAATRAGIINGYPDSTYRPDQNITRAEMTVLFSLAENRSLRPISRANFTDVSETHWAHQYIMNAASPMR
jgi:hypothetical protein